MDELKIGRGLNKKWEPCQNCIERQSIRKEVQFPEIKIIIPEKSLEAIAKIVFNKSKWIFTREYSDLDILRIFTS